MAEEISDEEKAQYQQMVKASQDRIDELNAAEKDLLLSAKDDSEEAALAQLAFADKTLDVILCLLEVDTVSKRLYNTKNEKALNEARKIANKGLACLENVVTGFVDAPFSDYEGKLAKIASFDAGQRYQLIEKMKRTIDFLKDAYGKDVKWKWSFVETDGRLAAVAKNLMDLKKAVANKDPRSPDYEPTLLHLRMIKELMVYAADRYRERYEMSTNSKDDFKRGIDFLGALFRIHSLIWEKDDAAMVKKKQEAWTAKLNTDIKNKRAR